MTLILSAAAATPVAVAQPAADSTEVATWSSYLFHLQDTGTPHPSAATFEFTDPAMNRPGVLPIAGAVRLFNALYKNQTDYDVSDCTYKSILHVLLDDPAAKAKFREYVLGDKQVATSAASGDVHVAHALAMFEALTSGQDFALTGGAELIGDELYTWNLTKSPTEAGEPTPLSGLESVQSLDAAIRTVAAQVALDSIDVQFDPILAIRGAQAANGTGAELAARLGSAGWEVCSLPVHLYLGETVGLLLTWVQSGEKVWIVDGGTGVVEGPFGPAGQFKLADIVSARADLTAANAGQLAILAGDVDCIPERPNDPVWPPGVVPPAPWLPPVAFPPNVPPNVPANPGAWRNWTCGAMVSGACFCSRSRTFCQTLRVFSFWGGHPCTLTRCYTERNACDWVPAVSGGGCTPPPPQDASCGTTNRVSSETYSGCGPFGIW